MGHHRVRSLGRDLSFDLSFLCFNFYFACFPPRTNVTLSLGFVDKGHTTPWLSLVNIQALNFLLRSEIYVSVEGQLRAAPLILDYEPLTRALVEAGQAIKASSPRLARIDVSVPGFLASRDLPPVQLPAQRAFPVVVFPAEEAGSSHSSLEDQIDQFHFARGGRGVGQASRALGL